MYYIKNMVKISQGTYNILRNSKNPGNAEKDFLECAILEKLFNDRFFSENFLFAGGASLSKSYHLSNRICQDIDLVCHTFDDIPDQHSRKRLDRFKKQFKNDVFTELKQKINEIINQNHRFLVLTDKDWLALKNPDSFICSPTLHLMYKSEFSSNMGHLCLEIIPRKYPKESTEYRSVTPYAIERPFGDIPTVRYEQTFWDKVYALHSNALAQKPHFNNFFSRHYYDAATLSRYVNLNNTTEMLFDIERHQSKYTLKNMAKLNTPSNITLLPSDEILNKLGTDYNQMSDKFLGIREDWQSIIRALKCLNRQLKTL